MSHPAQGEISLGIFLERFEAQRATNRHHFAFDTHMAVALAIQN